MIRGFACCRRPAGNIACHLLYRDAVGFDSDIGILPRLDFPEELRGGLGRRLTMAAHRKPLEMGFRDPVRRSRSDRKIPCEFPRDIP